MATLSIIINIVNFVLLLGWIIYGVYMTISRNKLQNEFIKYIDLTDSTMDIYRRYIGTLKAEDTLYKNQRDFYHDLLEKEREIRKK